MDINLECKSIEVSAINGKLISVDLNGCEKSDILSYFSVSDIVEHFGDQEILDKIGQKRCEDYFEIGL